MCDIESPSRLPARRVKFVCVMRSPDQPIAKPRWPGSVRIYGGDRGGGNSAHGHLERKFNFPQIPGRLGLGIAILVVSLASWDLGTFCFLFCLLERNRDIGVTVVTGRRAEMVMCVVLAFGEVRYHVPSPRRGLRTGEGVRLGREGWGRAGADDDEWWWRLDGLNCGGAASHSTNTMDSWRIWVVTEELRDCSAPSVGLSVGSARLFLPARYGLDRRRRWLGGGARSAGGLVRF